MAEQSLFIYTSPEPLSNDQSQDIDHGQQAVTQGDKHTHHYHAIPTGFKGIEPYLALSSFPITITAAHVPPQANKPSHHPIHNDTTGARSGPSSSLPSSASPDAAKPSHSSTASASNEQPHPRRTVPPPELKQDRLPRGKSEDIISWTDDDVDATDYKNMPDYDPNQEESEYDSTPPPETEIGASQILGEPSGDTSLVKRYVRIYSSAPTSSVEEVSGRATLYLFKSIPKVCRHNRKPLAPTFDKCRYIVLFANLSHLSLPASQPNTSYSSSSQGRSTPFPLPRLDTHTTPSQYENFLGHLARYPYLTSHDNYIRHTGYVLEPSSSTDSDAPSQYLIVQELSEMEWRAGGIMGVDWERHRMEAKHWWRKEERGARGVRAGFFKLANAEQIQKH